MAAQIEGEDKVAPFDHFRNEGGPLALVAAEHVKEDHNGPGALLPVGAEPGAADGKAVAGDEADRFCLDEVRNGRGLGVGGRFFATTGCEEEDQQEQGTAAQAHVRVSLEAVDLKMTI